LYENVHSSSKIACNSRERVDRDRHRVRTCALSMMKSIALVSFLLTACGNDSFDRSSTNVTGACIASGQACQLDSDCPAHEECEDAACKPHGDCSQEDVQGTQCTTDLDCAGLDCEHGTCQPHGGDGSDTQGTECVLDADCGGGLECEDGFCKPHGGDN
jgi:hypothetical protein